MTSYIKYGVVVAIVAAVYLVGYKHAESEGEAVLESLKLEHAKAIIEAQENEKAKYEETVKGLVAALNELQLKHNDRVRELENFRASATDLDTCHRQRGELASLAVEGEQLLNEASIYLDGGKQ